MSAINGIKEVEVASSTEHKAILNQSFINNFHVNPNKVHEYDCDNNLSLDEQIQQSLDSLDVMAEAKDLDDPTRVKIETKIAYNKGNNMKPMQL